MSKKNKQPNIKTWSKDKFKVGDQVVLRANPYDDELLEDHSLEMVSIQNVLEVMDTCHIPGTTGQWIKTTLEREWIDSDWYMKVDPKKKPVGLDKKEWRKGTGWIEIPKKK